MFHTYVGVLYCYCFMNVANFITQFYYVKKIAALKGGKREQKEAELKRPRNWMSLDQTPLCYCRNCFLASWLPVSLSTIIVGMCFMLELEIAFWGFIFKSSCCLGLELFTFLLFFVVVLYIRREEMDIQTRYVLNYINT